MASVKWSQGALQDLDSTDYVIAQRIVEKADWLGKNFSDVVPERLHHEFKDLYKLRIGDYRAIYSVRIDSIVIEAVGHRRNIYR